MGKCSHLIHRGKIQSLDAILFHVNARSISRIAWEGFPVHLAVHQVSVVEEMPERYVAPHTHNEPEINIILSDDELVYKIWLGDEIYEVGAPAAIWIPPGLSHSANVIRGSGQFVCMILANRYKAESASDGRAGVQSPVEDSD